MSQRILTIEDNDDIVESLRVLTEELGFELDRASTGPEGLKMAVENKYVCVLLDVMLPGMEGTEVCRQIRKQRDDLPIIMLTSKADDLHKILGLELGADDYVTKPFNQLELKARIKAVLRRMERGSTKEEILTFGPITIDAGRRQVQKNGQPVELTALQFDMLAILAGRAGRPVSREELSSELFGYDVSGFDQSLSVHISRIRAKLEDDPANPKFILTARGVGYTFAEATADS